MPRTTCLAGALALLICALGAAGEKNASAQAPAAGRIRQTPDLRFLPTEDEEEDEETAYYASLQPQPDTRPPSFSPDGRTTPEGQIRRASTAARRPPTRLASVPNMFGDFFGSGPVLTATFGDPSAGVVQRQFQSQIVPPGGGRRAKIGEQNNPLPTDRVYFFYNHFNNARAVTDVAGREFRFPIDRYTIGIEKTAFDGLASIEFRMPFSNSYNFIGNPAAPGEFSTVGGSIGNLTIIPKLLLAQSETTAFSAGMGIELPTGNNVTGEFFGGTYTIANESVHLSPYAAVMHLSSERLYWLGFLQFDLVANGNPMTFDHPNLGAANLGTYTDQNLCFLDLAGGYSFYVNPEARWLTRFSGQVELHYAGVLQNADVLNSQQGPLAFNLTPAASNIHMVNVTCALTGTLGTNTFLRIATSAPLRDAPHRFFDSEIQAAVIQRY